MNREDLEKAIAETQNKILELKQRLDQSPDPEEYRSLSLRLKELRYLQLWHIGQMESLSKD